MIEKILDRKNWTETVTTTDVMKLMRDNRDICEEKIKILNKHNYIEERTAFPQWCLNKYKLYQHLRKNGRVPRCAHAEKILKQERKQENDK